MGQLKSPDLWDMDGSYIQEKSKEKHKQKKSKKHGDKSATSTDTNTTKDDNKTPHKNKKDKGKMTVKETPRNGLSPHPVSSGYRGPRTPGSDMPIHRNGIITFVPTTPYAKPFILQKKLAQPPKKTGCLPDHGITLSLMYGLVLTLVGIAMAVQEALTGYWLKNYTTVAFLFYLYGVSIALIIILEVYLVHQNQQRRAKNPKYANGTLDRSKTGLSNGGFVGGASNGTIANGRAGSSYHSSCSSLAEVDVYVVGEEDSEANTDKFTHRSSLPLRIGASLFGLGSMIYEGLLLRQFHEKQALISCQHAAKFWPHYALLVFILVQTYFIFKHPQISVSKFKSWVRLGCMHVFATNICTWIRAVCRETLEATILHTHRSQGQVIKDDNITDVRCEVKDDALNRATPYLYPCLLEYTLISCTVVYVTYANLKQKKKGADFGESDDSKGITVKQSHFTEVNFHKSHRGLFLGLTVLAGTIVSIILYFSYEDIDQSGSDYYMLIYFCTDIALFVITCIAVSIAWIRVRVLSFTYWRSWHLEEVILVLSLLGALLLRILNVNAVIGWMIDNSADRDSIFITCVDILSIAVLVFQSSFIMDGFGRDGKTSRRHRISKPGRGTVMFLLIINIAMWVYRIAHGIFTHQEESVIPVKVYGFTAWRIMGNLLAPFLVYYHYQSASCLTYIWSFVYPMETVRHNLSKDMSASKQSVSVDTADMSTQVKVVELRRRAYGRGSAEGSSIGEMETVLSPCSEV